MSVGAARRRGVWIGLQSSPRLVASGAPADGLRELRARVVEELLLDELLDDLAG